jgi:hypothetical protein
MKAISRILWLAVLGTLVGGASAVRAELEVSADVSIHAAADFDAPLAARGTWITVGTYGRCWRPAGVAVSWRPYCEGHWVWTDCGWYWESDEPWAWACYHYGYWIYDSAYGWVWLPGVEWGPAWVSWRVGGGYIGWAPLPPPRVKVVEARFVFVKGAHFAEPIRSTTIIVSSPQIIRETRVINNIKHQEKVIGDRGSRRVVVNEGPGLSVVEKATGRKFERMAIQEAARRTPVPATVSHAPHGQPSGPPERTGKPAAPHQSDVAAPDHPPAAPRHHEPSNAGQRGHVWGFSQDHGKGRK